MPRSPGNRPSAIPRRNADLAFISVPSRKLHGLGRAARREHGPRRTRRRPARQPASEHRPVLSRPIRRRRQPERRAGEPNVALLMAASSPRPYGELMASMTREDMSLTIRRVANLTMVLACIALSACVGVSSLSLASLGSSISAQKIDFKEIYGYADRAKLAYSDEATIRTHYPKTLGVRSPGNSDIQYFIEQDDERKTQFITIRGTANKTNLLEDLEIRILADFRSTSPSIPASTGRQERYSPTSSHT